MRYLADNQVNEISINGHVLDACSHAEPCIGFQQPPYAATLPGEFLKPTGNDLRFVVYNWESYSTGAFTMDVVGPGLDVGTPAPDITRRVGTQMVVNGAFRTVFADEQNNVTVTADNTQGDFVDNGDGTWTWTFTPSEPNAARTIHVSAVDAYGNRVGDDFNYTAIDRPTMTITPSCTDRDPGSTTELTVTLAGDQPDDYYYVVFEDEQTGGHDYDWYEFFPYWYGYSENGVVTFQVSDTADYVARFPWLKVRGYDWETGGYPVQTAPVKRELCRITDLNMDVSGPDEVEAGAPITWTLTVTNDGPDPSSGYTVTNDVRRRSPMSSPRRPDAPSTTAGSRAREGRWSPASSACSPSPGRRRRRSGRWRTPRPSTATSPTPTRPTTATRRAPRSFLFPPISAWPSPARPRCSPASRSRGR